MCEKGKKKEEDSMSGRSEKQLTISKFFAPLSGNKQKAVRTDEYSPKKKKAKISETEFNPLLVRTNSSSSEEKSPKRTKACETFLNESKSNSPKVLSPNQKNIRNKLNAFRLSDQNKEEVNSSSPESNFHNGISPNLKNRGFKVPAGAKLTPLEQQVVAIKEQHPDTLLFVECGYKYRFFSDDAEIAAKELNIVAHLDHSFQTASIPTHRLHIHVRRLVAKGYKVGVVKQTETAALKAAGSNKTAPFSRELSALYTKATLIGEDVTPIGGEDDVDVTESTTSSLMVLMEAECKTHKDDLTTIAFVALQPNTGEILYDVFDDSSTRTSLWGRLEHIHPVEVLLSENVSATTSKAITAITTRHDDCIRTEHIPESVFEYSFCLRDLCQLFEGQEEKIRHLTKLPHLVICCLGATLHYLKEFKLEKIIKTSCNISKFCSENQFMKLPGATLRNLEVLVNTSDGGEKGSLFWVLNQTSTKFGARVLRQWLVQPLLHVDKITERQEMVEELINSDSTPITCLKNLLVKLPDFEKSITTIFYKKCSPHEFWLTVSGLSRIQRQLSSVCESNLSSINSEPLILLLKAVVDGLSNIHPFSENFNEVTNTKECKKTSLLKNWSEFPDVIKRQNEIKQTELQLKELQTQIAQVLGVFNFNYTTVSGLEYLIEVKNNNLKSVPSKWNKINSTKTCCRFRSPEVEKEFTKLQQLREQLQADCNEAWLEILERFSGHYQEFRESVKCLGCLDALISLAKVAQSNGYCKPEIMDSDSGVLFIEGGKHPIVNQIRGNEQFVANNTNLKRDSQRVMLVTGPNMGGKSCYMRQVALIAMMTQMGSYVPADSVRMSILDGIYTRMGASDEIFSGKSTFMMEVGETSNIMGEATEKSLVILDELGRGTATHDGVAIAMASLNFFLNQIKCFTIFVTHYLPLTEFENMYPDNVGNYHMAFIVNEQEDEDVDAVTFLYQLTSGSAGQSYGLNVARLANVPQVVLKNASEKSKMLEDLCTKRRKRKTDFKRIFCLNSFPGRDYLTSISENI